MIARPERRQNLFDGNIFFNSSIFLLIAVLRRFKLTSDVEPERPEESGGTMPSGPGNERADPLSPWIPGLSCSISGGHREESSLAVSKPSARRWVQPFPKRRACLLATVGASSSGIEGQSWRRQRSGGEPAIQLLSFDPSDASADEIEKLTGAAHRELIQIDVRLDPRGRAINSGTSLSRAEARNSAKAVDDPRPLSRGCSTAWSKGRTTTPPESPPRRSWPPPQSRRSRMIATPQAMHDQNTASAPWSVPIPATSAASGCMSR